MGESRKITVLIPKELLRTAQDSTGQGVTATVRRGLELLAASEAYERLLAFRGKYRSSLDLKQLREDRR